MKKWHRLPTFVSPIPFVPVRSANWTEHTHTHTYSPHHTR